MKKQQFFTFFHLLALFLPTLDPCNFVSFYRILLKFGMLIPLIAIYFCYYQCYYQLSKAKKLFKKNHFLGIFFTFKGA